SSPKLARDQTSNPTSSTNPTLKGRILRSSKQKVENSHFEEHLTPVATMIDNRTMAEMLSAPTEGCAEAIIVPPILADQFELKHSLINMMTSKQFFGLEKDNPHDHAVVAKVNSNSSTPAVSSDVAELKDMVRALLLDKKNQYSAQISSPTPASIKAVEPNCVTCGGSGTLPGNTVTNPKEDLKGITTQSGVAYQGPTIPTPSKVTKQGTEVTKDQVQTSNSQSTAPVQPTVTQSESKTPVSEPVVAPVSASMPNLKPSIPYPSRRDNERRRDQAIEQIEKFYKIFKEISFEISFMDALMLMPKFASTLKALIGNKEKLSEIARTSMNEHCSTVILNKLPKKLGDPRKFLIPCEFPRMDACLALADLGTSINLMPLSVWKGLDVKVKVGMFHFPADFVVVDFEPDPPSSLNSREKRSHHLQSGSNFRYSANYDQMTTNKINVTDEACEEYSQEVLGFSDVTASGSPPPSDDLIVSTTSLTLTPFGDSDFLLFEEADAFLGLEDDPDSPKYDPSYYDQEGDILSIEAILNSDPSPPLLNHEQYVPSLKEELKACEAKTIKSSIDEPPEVKLKDLPPHLEYEFLEGDNKFPVIIAKALSDEEKSALIKVLKSHKRAIAWKLSDIQENEYYCFLDGFFGYFQIPIDPRDQEKTTFTYPYGTFAYRRMTFGLYNAPGTFQRCMLAIFHDMVEKTMEVFMDDFSVFGNSFANCLSRLDKMLQRCEDTKLCLNWEKSHFMVKEGIVLGHKMSKNGIEVDKAKIYVIAKLPHPTIAKCVWSFLGAARRWLEKEPPHSITTWDDLVSKFINEFFPPSRTTNLRNEISNFQQKFDESFHEAWERYKDLLHACPHHGFTELHQLDTFYNALNSTDQDSLNAAAGGNLLEKSAHPYYQCLAAGGNTFPEYRDNIQGYVSAVIGNFNQAKALPTNDARVVCKFLKSLFARFGAPRAIISDHGTHFCNDQFEKVMRKYGVTHHLSTAYHLQTSGQVEVTNRGLKRILERTIGQNCASWSDKLDDALWAFRTAYKTPIGCTPYKLVYGKACHIPIELEHKAYWALKQTNFDMSVAGKLKSRWSGPFTISKVFPYGTVDLSQANGPNFKVNGHRIKYYFGGDVPQLVKENQEKDKIESKPDKNGKRSEAGKSQKQLQWIKEEKLKKMQKEGPEMQSLTSYN
nr:reverse transcriptase domain-containing protein [Tanacetum cinerariifolium]